MHNNAPNGVAETKCADRGAHYRLKKLNSDVFFVRTGAISIGTWFLCVIDICKTRQKEPMSVMLQPTNH